MAAAEALNATVADMRFVKPLDEALVRQLAASHRLLVTVEENVIQGGAGGPVLEALAAAGLDTLSATGLPDSYIDTATRLLLADCGLDAAGLEGQRCGRG